MDVDHECDSFFLCLHTDEWKVDHSHLLSNNRQFPWGVLLNHVSFLLRKLFFWRQGIDKGEKTHLSESLSTCHIRGCEWMLWNFAELARGLIFSPLRIFILYQRVVSNSLCCRILQRLFSHFLTTDGWLPRRTPKAPHFLNVYKCSQYPSWIKC